MMLTAVLALLLQQPRDVPAASHGTAAISGVVVSDDEDARPVRHARVTCTASGVLGQTAITDDRGRFAFADLAGGRYLVGATKTAWIGTWYGSKRPGRPGTTIPIADGQQLQILLRMPRGAVVSGVVLDYNGEPAARASVQAMKSAIVDGERRLVAAGSSTVTDDRGSYRLYGLLPGDYAIQAVVRGGAQELYLTSDLDLRYAASPARTPPPQPRTVKFAVTYYPSATSGSQSTMVTLAKGQERDGIDIQMQLEPTVRIEGVVAPTEFGVPPGTEVILASTTPSGALAGAPPTIENRRRVASDGAFVFANVPPGSYTLVARAAKPTTQADGSPGPPQFMWTSTEIAVAGEPVTGLVLSLQPGMSVAGRVQFTRTTLSPPDVTSVRVTLQPVIAAGLVAFAPVPVSPDADGRFTIRGVTPGRYRLSATVPGAGRTAGWTLRSAAIAGQDTLDVPITIQPNQNITDAVITFVDRAAALNGTVLDTSGHPAPGFTVVIFPADQTFWLPQARRIQGVRSSADGAFTIASLPPGEYIVSAVDDIEPGEWFDPVVLQRLLLTGTKLAIGESEHKTLDVRAGGGG
jgi:uncharacterized protein (DUF2141 family)